MSRYIALTIGPIVDTLTLGRKTAEIWGASYLFSSFMKKVIDTLRQKEVTFLVPSVEDESIFAVEDGGVGLFHDRFILTSETLTLEEVQTIITEQKEHLSETIAHSIKRELEPVQTYLEHYLQTYLIEVEGDYDNPTLEISDLLDSVELHTPPLPPGEDFMKLFLRRDTLLASEMAKEAFGTKPSFLSIPEIATQKEIPQKGDDDDIYAKLRGTDGFKQAHKYIAIVHADGDNLGTYIKQQADPAIVSRRLFAFDKAAVKAIREYGGVPIFVGGDDLLFFAPVMTQTEAIFALLERLDKLYTEKLDSDEVSLSFGVSITYYKYPLYEALTHSREALFGHAKQYPGKNAVGLGIRKHSGQSFEATLSKSEEAYRLFRDLLRKVLIEDIELPHAIHHKLDTYRPLLTAAPTERLEMTFENLFNEEIHQTKFKDGLKAIRQLMETQGTDETSLEKLFALLSIIKLLRSDRDD